MEGRSKIGRPQSGLRPVPVPVAWVEVPGRPTPGDSELVETARGMLRLPEPWAKGSTVRGTVHQAECQSKIGRPQSGLRPVPDPVAWDEIPEGRPSWATVSLWRQRGGGSASLSHGRRRAPCGARCIRRSVGARSADRKAGCGQFESRWRGSRSPAGPNGDRNAPRGDPAKSVPGGGVNLAPASRRRRSGCDFLLRLYISIFSDMTWSMVSLWPLPDLDPGPRNEG